ncbi:MAG TPA: signal peptidase I [Gaiellaceae bacterium]|nr:signal peptidase I [Gaiellaceae bacterium]
MSDHFDWNPPPDDEEEKPEAGAEEKTAAPPPGEDPWHAESHWPSFDRPEESESQRQRSDYGGYGQYAPYGETQVPRDPFLSSTSEDRYHDHKSRDPLARLFPGLPRSVRVTLDWILTIVGAILIVLALKEWVVNPYRIPSSSMEPTLNCARGPTEPGCLGNSSDRVLACRICLDFGPPARNDIVVFNTPTEAALKCGEGGTFVKRVIGLPGETVREDDNGFISVEAPGAKKFVKLKEPYLSAQARLADTAHFGQVWHVKPDSYFMMGDNRSQSCDSRTWGSVPRSKLIGTVFFVYWPPDRIGFR